MNKQLFLGRSVWEFLSIKLLEIPPLLATNPSYSSTVFSVFPGSAEFFCSTYIVIGCSSLDLKHNVGPAAWEAAYKNRPILLVRERERQLTSSAS